MVSTENIQIITHNSELYWKEVDLRYKVLRKPLGLDFNPDQLAAESTDTHVIYAINDEIFGCMILTKIDENTLKMRQVAVDDKVQEVGIGTALVKYAEEYARSNGYHQITCNARKSAVAFYEKVGWLKVGDEFTEVGIPHYRMDRVLG